MRWLEHRIPPPLAALIVAAAMGAAARFETPLAAPRALAIGVALALGALGAYTAVSGFLTFRQAGANPDPLHIDRGQVLVTGGVYRRTRNPMYLGLALVLCGFAFYLMRPLEALGPIILVAFLTRFQIAPEEAAMRAKFGAAYEDYRRTTRRWL